MKPLAVTTIANFFDEVDEQWLELFDWCPNEKLPHAQRKTYRIKDLFLAKYRRKICRFNEDEIDDCRTEFHFIFRDSILIAIQMGGELEKLKKIADADMYDTHIHSKRKVDVTSTNSNTNTTTSTNAGTVKNKQGALAGTVDAIQLGTIISEDKKVVDINRLPESFDKNIRQYSQNAGINEEITDLTVTDNITSGGRSTLDGSQTSDVFQGVEGLNAIRAHTVKVRRLREEFIQRFNVLFY